MDEYLEANRKNWDDRVPIHVRSEFYDVPGWLADERGPLPSELALVGDVTGKSLLQLQCHFGMETLQWARAGAIVTGLDFSQAAIDAARELATKAGLDTKSTFVCSDVYEATEALRGQRFDVVYVTIGALCWLPDVRAWAKVVASALEPGGQFYLFEVHPFSACIDDDGMQVTYDYFQDSNAPMVIDDGTTYTDGGSIAHTTTFEWIHSLADIIQSLIDEGLVIDTLLEHDWTVFQQFPWLEKDADGIFQIPSGRPRIPLTFTLHAHS